MVLSETLYEHCAEIEATAKKRMDVILPQLMTLADLHKSLLDQHIPEADRVAQALDLYVSGSLNVFNHRTNIDIKNRIVAFDIKELGKQARRWTKRFRRRRRRL